MQQDNIQPNPYGSVDMPPEYLRVGFGMRFLAWLVDWFLVMIVAGLAAFVIVQNDISVASANPEATHQIESVYRWMGISAEEAAEFAHLAMSFTYALTLIAFGYSLISAFFGASPGKMIFGLTVAHADGRRGSMSLWFRRWAVRDASVYLQMAALLPTLSFLDTIGSIIGFVIFVGCFMALGQARLALHDRIAQTAVFRRSDLH